MAVTSRVHIFAAFLLSVSSGIILFVGVTNDSWEIKEFEGIIQTLREMAEGGCTDADRAKDNCGKGSIYHRIIDFLNVISLLAKLCSELTVYQILIILLVILLAFVEVKKMKTGTSGQNQQIALQSSEKDSFSYQVPSMYPGRLIRVKASTTSTAEVFSINLQNGPSIHFDNDIAIHIAFRFTVGSVALNAMTSSNGARGWGHEVGRPIPIARGEPFEAVIICNENAFKVLINGEEFTEFQHRTEYQTISHLHFKGDVNIQAISYEGDAE